MIGRLAEFDPAIKLVERRGAPHIGFGQSGPLKLGHAGGKGLGRRRPFAGNGGRRHRPFLDLGQGPAGAAVQHEYLPRLGGLDQRRHRTIGGRKIRQHRLRRQVIVPQIMMHRLEHPAHRAGIGIQRHRRGGEALGFRGAVRAVIVGAAIAHRDIDQAQRLVAAEGRPGIRRRRRIDFARRQWSLLVRLAGIEGPFQRARHRVIAADHAGRHPRGGVVDNESSDHGGAVHDRGRRCRIDPAARGGLQPQAFRKIDRAILAEAAAKPARLGVERDQLVVHRAHQKTGGTFGNIGGAIEAYAAANPAPAHFHVDLGVMPPDLLAGRRVQRVNRIVGVAAIEQAFHHDGRDFQLVGGMRVALLQADMIGPGFFQIGGIGGGDLGQAGIARGVLRAAVMGPFAIGGGCCRRRRGQLGLGHATLRCQEDRARHHREHKTHQQGHRSAIRREVQQQKSAGGGGEIDQTRHQRPAVQSHFPQRP